ncbi:MAG TPA: hypothetical protein VLC95_02445 [Anaerolineae bacterium]|nr:hypothetical protein [Anaerolineae bacterium]
MLLIAGDWQFRALVRAQLIETGYEVIAFPRLDVALAYLMRGPRREDGTQPAATIVDLTELDASLAMLVDLWRLTDQAPLLLCGGILDRTLLQSEKLPPAHVLRRPFSVGDVVNEVRRIDRWSSSKAAGA